MFELACGIAFARTYVVDGQIGQGASSVVYRARDAQSGRRVAIKVVAMDTELNRARLMRELAAIGRVGSTAAPECYEVRSNDTVCAVVSEHLAGSRPGDDPDPLDPGAAVAMTHNIAVAVATLQKQDVVHRDIHPWNVIENPSGEVRIFDFGSAWSPEWGTVAVPRLEARGSPGYAAPEQLAGAPAHPSADVFSIGAVLVQRLTGAQPHLIAQGSVDAAAGMPDILMDLAVESANVPGSLAPCLGSLLDRDPARRPPDAVAAARMLADVLTRYGSRRRFG